MRALLTSFGTTGDVFPLCTLARELQRHGHDATVVVPPHCASLVHDLGLECVPYGPDVSEIQLEILKTQNAGAPARERYKQLVARLGDATLRAFSDVSVLCRGMDVLICSLDPPLGLTLHETTRVPYVALHLTCPYDDSWYRSEKVAAVNRFRALLRLRPIEDEGDVDPTGISPQLTLFALSRHIFPRRPEWPPHFHVTGFFFADEEAWEPDPALARFVEAGAPPVVLTFGSMVYEDPQAVNDLLLAAVERVGCRAILQMGPVEMFRHRRLPPTVHVVGFASHSWLFSRAECVVHHGSPGTAASVFRAGVPAVFVPHAFDQFEVAVCAQARGCAGDAIPFTALTVERLSAAIADVRGSRWYREAAIALRDEMAGENGVRTARELIERLVRDGPRPGAGASRPELRAVAGRVGSAHDVG